eukprot:gene29065-36135_t
MAEATYPYVLFLMGLLMQFAFGTEVQSILPNEVPSPAFIFFPVDLLAADCAVQMNNFKSLQKGLLAAAPHVQIESLLINSTNEPYSVWYQISRALDNATIAEHTVGILGPRRGIEILPVTYEARKFSLPNVIFQPTYTSTDSYHDTEEPMLFHMEPEPSIRTDAMFQLLKHYGWKRATLLTLVGSTDMKNYLEEVKEQAEDAHIVLTHYARYLEADIIEVDASHNCDRLLDTYISEDLEDVIDEVLHEENRILLLNFENYDFLNGCIVSLFSRKGLSDDSWTWVGLEWPNANVWKQAFDEEGVRKAMEGMLTVSLAYEQALTEEDFSKDTVSVKVARDGNFVEVTQDLFPKACLHGTNEDESLDNTDLNKEEHALAYDSGMAFGRSIQTEEITNTSGDTEYQIVRKGMYESLTATSFAGKTGTIEFTLKDETYGEGGNTRSPSKVRAPMPFGVFHEAEQGGWLALLRGIQTDGARSSDPLP